MDGMADGWELAHEGITLTSEFSPEDDFDGDGYRNIENYINSLLRDDGNPRTSDL